MENQRIKQYLNCTFQCDCGRTHKSLFAHFIFETGAIGRLPELLAELGYARPYLICDTHTYEIAGKKAEEVLGKAEIPFVSHVLQSPENSDLAPHAHRTRI